jgi:glycosyltransferase involved in cell wall biosynthesis
MLTGSDINFEMENGLRIRVDGSFIETRSAGIARDFERIRNYFAEFEYDIFYNPGFVSEHKIKRRFAIGARGLIGPRPYTKKDLEDSKLFIPQIRGFYPTEPDSTLIRIHDLFPITYPNLFSKLSRKLFVDALKKTHKNCAFITNSIATSLVLKDTLGIKKERIFLQHCLPPSDVSRFALCKSPTLEIEGTYFLAIGTIEPRKNYHLLLEAFSLYKNRGGKMKLVVVGKRGWLNDSIVARLLNTQGVIWLENVCDRQLYELIISANAYISTSIDEGFNMPAAEARNLGKYLLLSDIPIHRELHESRAILLPFEADIICDQMLEVSNQCPVNNFSKTWINGAISYGFMDAVRAL